MATTYSYTINAMTSLPSYLGFSDVVSNVFWTRTAVDGEYSSSFSSNTPIPFDPEAPFTPYNELTELQVMGWVGANSDPSYIASLDASLDQQIFNQKYSSEQLPLPWVVSLS